MIKQSWKSLFRNVDPVLVDQLFETYAESKQNFYLGKMRIQEVEGGRYCEAAFRILEQVTTSKYTPLSKPLNNTDTIIANLASLSVTQYPDSIRIHIPRTLRLIYDIRNKRDAAHLSDNIDPNLQDSTLVCSCLDWILAEFIRYFHGNGMSASEAHHCVDNIITRRVPVVQDFDGSLKILNSKLQASQVCLVLLYHCGADGAKLNELKNWVPLKMKANLKRTLQILSEDKAMVHENNEHYKITRLGQNEVENKKLFELK